MNVALTDDDRRLWRGISSRWAAFAKTGKPEIATGPDWPVDGAWWPVVLEFGETTEAKPGFMAQRLNTLNLGLKLVGRPGATQ